ncbi:hypothetical protein Hanom_Chr07g00594521 [Helianthus anomalus]
MAKLEVFVGGSKTYIPKNFYRIGGSKTYISKNFCTKTTCTTLLSEKFGGAGAPPGPLNATPLHWVTQKESHRSKKNGGDVRSSLK